MRFEVVSSEQEVRDGMRAFGTAQQRLTLGLTRNPEKSYGRVTTGWYGSIVDERRGAFAYVSPDQRLADLVGDVIEVRSQSGHRTYVAFVYVVGSYAFPFELGLSRRAFVALDVLSKSEMSTTVAVWE